MPTSAAISAREILTGLHEVMAARGSVQGKLDRVVDLIAEKMESEVCSIYLLRDNKLELFATHGLRKEAVHVTKLRMGEGLVGTIAAEGRILNLAEAAEHAAFAYRPETGEESFHSFAGVPIVRLESPIGVLAVQHAEPRCYEDVEIEALQTVAMVLSEMIAASGLLVTEFSLGSAPEDWHFPRRNRIISGLSKAVVVVEAKEKSGSLITARLAADQGRDVMAVPGTFVGGRNRGANALLRDGAKLVESAVDILQELGLDDSLARRSPKGEGGQVVEFTVDEIAQQLKIPAGEALARLLEWELTGEVRRIGSGRFVRSRSKV